MRKILAITLLLGLLCFRTEALQSFDSDYEFNEDSLDLWDEEVISFLIAVR